MAEERSNRKLLLHVARATDSGKSAPFIASDNKDRIEDNWRSGKSSSEVNIAQENEDVQTRTVTIDRPLTNPFLLVYLYQSLD